MNSKTFKGIELILLFVGIPLLYRFKLLPGHKFIPLLIVFLICLFWLFWNKNFDRKKFGFNAFNSWKYLLYRTIIATILIFLITWVFIPESLFYLPRKAFRLWIVIMLLYPIWSAYPQELIYRAFFFERYKDLFSNKWLMILTNSFLFGFLHIIFGNWIAVLGATIIGFVFSLTYSKHQSLLTVAIEHAIIGDIVFTIGLGQFFYVPDF